VRFVVAIVAFVLAAASIGLGVAQRTILLGPSSISSSVVTADTPLTIIDSSTLNANAGTQTIEVEAAGDVMLAYGRTADVMAWVGEASYNEITWDAEAEELRTSLHRGTEDAAYVPSPVGSDLWLREFTGTDLLTRKLNAPEGISIIIAIGPGGDPSLAPDPADADGDAEAEAEEEPAADAEAEAEESPAGDTATVSIRWPLDTSAPMSGPLVIGGIVLLLVGLGLFLWALVHARSGGGPRRSTPKLPKKPKPPQLKPPQSKRKKRGEGDSDGNGAGNGDGDGDGPGGSDGPGSGSGSGEPRALDAAPTRAALRSSGSRGGGSRSGATRSAGRRRAFTALAGLGVAVVALTGCTPLGTQPVTPLASDTPGAQVEPVVVTKTQFSNILIDIVDTVADADEARDADLAAVRLAGAALELREANYKIRAKSDNVSPLPAIPSDVVEIQLPQQSSTWPRSVFAVTSAEGVPPMGLVMTQQSPRENYKLTYAVTLIATVPDVAPAEIGTAQLAPDNKLALVAPNELATAYGDLLLDGEEAARFDLFQAEGDSLREAIGAEKKKERAADLPRSAKLVFSHTPGETAPVAFVTNDTGQIVATMLNDIETVTPVEAGAAVNPKGQVRALLGKAQSTRGIVATYGVQLLFYVPPVSAPDRQVVLLGYAQGLVKAVEAR